MSVLTDGFAQVDANMYYDELASIAHLAARADALVASGAAVSHEGATAILNATIDLIVNQYCKQSGITPPSMHNATRLTDPHLTSNKFLLPRSPATLTQPSSPLCSGP